MPESRAEMDLGRGTLSLETGKLAIQAHGAVTVRAGDTLCLVTACSADQPRAGADFFPLTVDYEERLYAAGKIPGSFFRREGRPSEKAILVNRLTDRGLRPLFPSGVRNDVQVIATSLSTDRENPMDILAMIGASAAIAVSGIPIAATVGSARVGYTRDHEWVVYPTVQEADELLLDLVVSATRDHIMMIEAGAREVSEDTIVEGCRLAYGECLRVIDLIESLKAQVAPKPKVLPIYAVGDDVTAALAELDAPGRYDQALRVDGAGEQHDALSALRDELIAALTERFGEERKSEFTEACSKVMKKAIRRQVLEEGRRPDGRGPKELRHLAAEVGITPRSHGCGLFLRGLTQVLCTATLGTVGEGQKLDGLEDNEPKTFMHHYNMPPYSTGEAYIMRGPSRRAIGHGALAERALRSVIPGPDEFPYALRLVSEVLSSNGSTSMASVCAGSLSMMDAGIPVSAAVGGIAMGIVYESPDRYCILTDIQGIEDYNGDMDFKVAGTRDGVTAMQLDVKTQGLTTEILTEALAQAKDARMAILDVMDACIAEPRPELSPYAPRVVTVVVPVEKIGTVIGPGGKTIRRIEEFGVQVEIEDDGRVFISGTDAEAAAKAAKLVKDLVRDPELGEVFEDAIVTRLMPFGAFCEILPGKEGLLHVSDYAWEHTPQISDVLKVGDRVTLKLKEIDDQGRINLSRKDMLERPAHIADSGDSGRRPSGGARRRPGGDRPGGDRPRGGGGRRGGGGGSEGGVTFRDKQH